MADPIKLTVSEVITETPDACSLVFEQAFPYRPGQFLTLRIPSDRTGSVARCYSLCSSPQVDGHPAITVKRTPDGYASNWICDNAKPGTTFEALGPAGVFTPRSLDGDLLLLAAGSGITPIMSIIKSTLAAGAGGLVLLYANRDEQSVIFRDRLRALTERHPDRLTVIHWLESVQGLPSAAHVRALTAPFDPAEVMICGPKPFMSIARTAMDLPKSRVHLERFVSLGGNPFDDATPTSSDDSRASTVEVVLDGERRRLRWPAQTRLLDLFLENGLAAPYSCREGACSACACRLVSGEVKMLNNEVLEQEDLDEGIILACQSLPVTDTIEISYE
ncbi:MAG TPA: ferredoxin--NADP reductase [Actinophytocola sp.]|uniref:ferredoxin--NADP reductase n=1 Tax=Actinophytocola sp. TaxID=1872138 RepID=UPI002DDC94B3|nr:ferredoxin--NADP reductase [Actinophytocola sp.]HEV2781749.1 ferredoxin--NADP reductase [Actinophytocola sp.]